MRTAANVPATVERYVKEHLDQGLEEGKAWAVAWSRYCAYKNPGSPRCHQEEYFPGRQASIRVAGRYLGARLVKLPRPLVRKVNEGLLAEGFGGGLEWASMAEAGRELERALEAAGAAVYGGSLGAGLTGPSGSARFALVDEAGEPSGSVLTVHWGRLESGGFEVVSYV